MLDGGSAEQFFLHENFGVGEFAALRRDDGVTFFYLEKAEQCAGVDDWQQVIGLEGEVVGQAEDVVPAFVVDENLEQSRDAAGTGVRKEVVAGLLLLAGGTCVLRLMSGTAEGFSFGRVRTL